MDSKEKLVEFNKTCFVDRITTCKEYMFSRPGDVVSNYNDGKVMTLGDLDIGFISGIKDDFYWNLFDELYLGKDVLMWGFGFINFDNVKYGEDNKDALAYAYPTLTARARLDGNEMLATILRRYKISHSLDLDKLARQLVSATPEFVDEFVEPIHRPFYNFNVKEGEQCFAVTEENIKMVMNVITRWLEKTSGECQRNVDFSYEILDHVHIDGINIVQDKHLPNVIATVYPGATVQIDNRYLRIGKIVFIAMNEEG